MSVRINRSTATCPKCGSIACEKVLKIRLRCTRCGTEDSYKRFISQEDPSMRMHPSRTAVLGVSAFSNRPTDGKGHIVPDFEE